jgi:hypothetical protein
MNLSSLYRLLALKNPTQNSKSQTRKNCCSKFSENEANATLSSKIPTSSNKSHSLKNNCFLSPQTSSPPDTLFSHHSYFFPKVISSFALLAFPIESVKT